MDNFNLRAFLAKNPLNEAMSPQDVVDIADTVAEEFTIESAEEGDFMVYSVGEMDVDNMFFELDTDVTAQTPERILKMSNLGVGEGWGGSFRINPKEEGYEVRNSEKGGLVAIIDGMGNFKMISADESRAEMGRAKGEETDYMQRRKETDDYMQEGEDEVKEIKPNKMKKSELKEMIRAAFLNEVEEKEDMNEADNHPSEVFTDVELDMASEMLMGMFDKLGLENNVEKSDALVKYINAWFETNDFVNEEEEVEVDTEVEDEAGDEIDVDASAEEEVGVEMDQEAGEGLSGDKKSVQDSLEAALQGARALGDEKLADQIGNSITFFTRTHVVGQDQVAEAEIGLEEVYADKEEMFQIHTTDSPDGKGKWSPWAGQFFPNARSADEWMKKMEDGGYKFGLKKVPVPPKEVKEAEGDKYFQIHVANQKGEYKPLQGHVFPNPESADEFIKKIKAKGSFKDGIKKLPATPEDLKVAETQLNESVNRMKKLAGLIK